MNARILALAIAAMGVLASASAANAQMTWPIQNQAPFEVEVQFYGRDRNVVWPGGNRVWHVGPHQRITPTLACRPGEYICYGAWRTGDARMSWGVGRGGTLGCNSCCFNCANGTVSGHNLLPY